MNWLGFSVNALNRYRRLNWNLWTRLEASHTCFFLNLVPSSEEISFWPPAMVYISVIITLMNESASRGIWITMEIFLAPSRIQTHRDRESSVISPLLYLQATTAGWLFTLVVNLSGFVSKSECCMQNFVKIESKFVFLLSIKHSVTQPLRVWEAATTKICRT